MNNQTKPDSAAHGGDVVRERDLLAAAIAEAAIKCGLLRPDIEGLTGPQLLMLCDGMAAAISQTAGVPSELAELSAKATQGELVARVVERDGCFRDAFVTVPSIVQGTSVVGDYPMEWLADDSYNDAGDPRQKAHDAQFTAAAINWVRAMLAAAPAASGGEPDPLCVQRKAACDFPRCACKDEEPQPQAGASVSERAREVLAQQFPGDAVRADWAMKSEFDGFGISQGYALRAVEQALTQQRGIIGLYIDRDERGLIREVSRRDYLGRREVIACNPEYVMREKVTPQPGAEAMRELVRRAIPFLRDEGANYADDGSNEPLELAREMESLLARGGE